jgi:hypothetical protein
MTRFERVHLPSFADATEWLDSEPLGPYDKSERTFSDSHRVVVDDRGHGVLRDSRLYQIVRHHDAVWQRTLQSLPSNQAPGHAQVGDERINEDHDLADPDHAGAIDATTSPIASCSRRHPSAIHHVELNPMKSVGLDPLAPPTTPTPTRPLAGRHRERQRRPSASECRRRRPDRRERLPRHLPRADLLPGHPRVLLPDHDPMTKDRQATTSAPATGRRSSTPATSSARWPRTRSPTSTPPGCGPARWSPRVESKTNRRAGRVGNRFPLPINAPFLIAGGRCRRATRPTTSRSSSSTATCRAGIERSNPARCAVARERTPRRVACP